MLGLPDNFVFSPFFSSLQNGGRQEKTKNPFLQRVGKDLCRNKVMLETFFVRYSKAFTTFFATIG